MPPEISLERGAEADTRISMINGFSVRFKATPGQRDKITGYGQWDNIRSTTLGDKLKSTIRSDARLWSRWVVEYHSLSSQVNRRISKILNCLAIFSLRSGPAIFFLRTRGGKRYSRGRLGQKPFSNRSRVEEFSTVIPGKEINP
jgi:hypothetical protein